MDEKTLTTLIDKLIQEKMKEGQIKCCFCGKTITRKNLGALFMLKDGAVCFVCDSIECLVKAVKVHKSLTYVGENK